MSKDEATVEVDESTEDNELDSYFDDPDAEVETDVDTEAEEEAEDTAATEESEEVEEGEESEDDDSQQEEAEQATEQQAEAQEEPEDDTASEEQVSEDTESNDKSKDELAKEAFKRREAERKLRDEQNRREAENLQRYLDEAGEDEAELNKRQLEVQQYALSRERSQVLQDKLDVGINKAVLELKIDPKDTAAMNYLARRLDDFESSRVVKDRGGNIVEVRGNVYQYIKEEMDSISQFRSIGAREQASKKAKEKARTVKTPTRTPKEKPVDEDLLAFDEEADKW